MKDKAPIIVLIVVCVLLGIGWLITHNNAVEEKNKDTKQIQDLSGNLSKTKTDLDEQKKVNTTLETNLQQRTEEARALSNNLATTSATLKDTEDKLAKTEADAKAAAAAAATAAAEAAAKIARQEGEAKRMQEDIAQRNTRISELEANRDDLTKKMGDLNVAINKLNGQIADTEHKLSVSEGDRDFLLKELKRLQSEKAELEKQMNDLAYLREQYKKLKEEMNIAKRLEWIRKGIYGIEEKKPGQIQNEGFSGPPTVKTNYNLTVELKKDGTVTIVTNAPPPKVAPAPAPVKPAKPADSGKK